MAVIHIRDYLFYSPHSALYSALQCSFAILGAPSNTMELRIHNEPAEKSSCRLLRSSLSLARSLCLLISRLIIRRRL